MISFIHKRLEGRDEGFTLIELLVVVIIIGILAAIAIPVFLNQRERGWAGTAESDARNAAINVETIYTASTDQKYVAGSGTTGSLAGFKPSNQVTTTVTVDTTGNKYCIKSKHARSADADTVWLPSDGTLTRSATAPTGTACA